MTTDPIYSPNRLASVLGYPRRFLEEVARDPKRYFRPFEKKKPGKKPRHIDNPVAPLKTIQGAIYAELLKGVELPSIIQGAVPGGSAEKNAALHVGKGVVVTLDVEACFPSITNNHVFHVWRYVLGHSPSVARRLTQLTTFAGHLPQGASTSSFLANLVILPAVLEIQAFLQAKELELGQFVDDLGMSGPALEHDVITRACEEFSRIGLRIGRRKLRVMRAGAPQIVTGFTVNSKVGIPRKERAKIRAAVHQLELTDVASPGFEKQRLSVLGRVKRLLRYHPHDGQQLLRRVLNVAA